MNVQTESYVGCKHLTKCMYHVLWDLGCRVTTADDQKLANNDLVVSSAVRFHALQQVFMNYNNAYLFTKLIFFQMSKPPGIQRIRTNSLREEMAPEDNDRPCQECGNHHSILAMTYVTNCRHNKRWRGHGAPIEELIPHVLPRV